MENQKNTKVFNKTKEFKELESTWNQKLKEVGFNDIETDSERDNNYINKQIVTPNPKWINYFRKCSAFLLTGKIKDKVDLFVFTLHCDGMTNREIVDVYAKAFKFDTISHTTVQRRIHKVLELAEIEPVHFPNV